MTRTEVLFLLKAYEEQLVTNTTLLSASVANAISNVLRKKGKRPNKLWKKKPKAGDVQERTQDIAIAKTVQEQDGSNWIQKIYLANRRKLQRKDKNDIS